MESTEVGTGQHWIFSAAKTGRAAVIEQRPYPERSLIIAIFFWWYCVILHSIYFNLPQRILHDGDFLNLGGREIQVVHTPGHSPGHCCFYEPERNYLYSGDLIYKGSLDAFYPTTDPKLFYQSIRRIRKYNIKKVLPGHHQLDIPVSLIADIEAGFAQLERAGKLKQGNGLFKFQDFQIHI